MRHWSIASHAIGCLLSLPIAVSMSCAVAPSSSPVSLTPTGPGPGRGAAATTVFLNVAVIPMDRERVLTGQTVVVREGRVTSVGPVNEIPVPAGATRIDGTGKFLLPGLADMHVHLQTYDSATAERILFLFLANGVTTIRNMDYLPFPLPSGYRGVAEIAKLGGPTLLGFRARTATGALLGPHMYTSAAWGGGFPGDYQAMVKAALGRRQSNETQEQVDTLVARYKAAGYDFIKVHDEDRTLYTYLVNAAHRVGIPVAGHVPLGVPLDQALAAHQKSIEHLTGYEDQPDFPSHIPMLVAATKRAGVWNCPTLMIAAGNDGVLTPAAKAQWPEMRYYSARTLQIRDSLARGWRADSVAALQKLTAERQLVKALQDSGAGLLLGTDTPWGELMPGFAVHHELEALVAAGLTPYQALAAGTKNVATYFGTERESGTIAVGKRADVVLLTGNPLTDIRQTTHIAGVMIGGRWLPRAELDHRLAGYVGTLEDPFFQLKELMSREAGQIFKKAK